MVEANDAHEATMIRFLGRFWRNGDSLPTRSGAGAARRRPDAGQATSKVFCVGRNKTGTTSLAAALRALGYRVGHQRTAEALIEDWGRRDFRRLIDYCRSADAFQDVPFSHDYTFQAMDAAFPGSKFILTVRSSEDEWYESFIRFHTQRLGHGRLPTPDELKADPYVFPGWIWRVKELVHGPAEEDLFREDLYKAHYRRHNERVQDYFRHRPDDLLVLNLADDGAMQSLCRFLGRPWTGQAMPCLNRSA